jgi:hypothetical protein
MRTLSPVLDSALRAVSLCMLHAGKHMSDWSGFVPDFRLRHKASGESVAPRLAALHCAAAGKQATDGVHPQSCSSGGLHTALA